MYKIRRIAENVNLNTVINKVYYKINQKKWSGFLLKI